MINQITKFHKELKKGESVKIMFHNDFETYINRTDLIKQEGKILLIFRANGARVAYNTDYVVQACIVERL